MDALGIQTDTPLLVGLYLLPGHHQATALALEDKGNAARARALVLLTHGEKVAEEGDHRPHPHERLMVEGEERQDEDGAGLDMESVHLVMLQDGIEEIGRASCRERV